MPRPEKVQAVADIKERIEAAQAVFLTEYAGLSVKEQQELRRELKANGAEMKVVKMTLARLAAEDMVDEVTELLLGPTSMTFADGDPAAAAKALSDFAKDHDVLVIKGGVLGAEFLTPERIGYLAGLPTRDELLAQIAGLMEAPMTQAAGMMAALPRQLVTLIDRLAEQGSPESGVESPEPEDSADETVDDADPPATETTTEQPETTTEQPETTEDETTEDS